MLKEIYVKGKQYIFASNLLILFEYNNQLMNIVDDIKNGHYIDNKDYEQVKKILEADEKAEQRIKKSIKNYINNKEINLNSAQINVQYGCNLSCKYCFAGDGCHNKKGRMNLETCNKVMSFIESNSQNTKSIYIQIVGGEPLLNMDAFREVVMYSNKNKTKDKEIAFTTTTNGTLFTDKIIEFFNENNITYMVSLDSTNKEIQDFLRVCKNENESSFEKIMDGYLRYKDISKYDTVHVTVTPYNLNIAEIADKLYDAGIKHVHLALVKSEQKEFIFTKEHIEILKKEYDKLADILIERISKGQKISCHPLMDNLKRLDEKKPKKTECGVIASMFAFDPIGNIYPCDMLMWDDYKLGNVKSECELDKVKIGELKEVLINESKCLGCFARYLCGGMCLVDKLNDNEVQRKLICDLKRFVCKLQIYMYDTLNKRK